MKTLTQAELDAMVVRIKRLNLIQGREQISAVYSWYAAFAASPNTDVYACLSQAVGAAEARLAQA